MYSINWRNGEEKSNQRRECGTANIHWNSIANKINRISTFSVEDATEIKNAFFPEWKIEKLFKKEE